MRLETLLRRWRRGQLFALALRALGVTLGVGALMWALMPPGPARWLMVVVVASTSAVASIWLPRPPMADRDLLARHLDRVVPELEDSTDLVDQEGFDLTDLELLQAERVRVTLAGLPESGLWPRAQMLGSLRLLLGGAVVALLVLVGQMKWADRGVAVSGDGSRRPQSVGSLVNPLQLVTVEVLPPAYTGQPVVQQSALDIEAAEGSRIRWWLPPQIDSAVLLFAGRDPREFDGTEEGLEVEMMARESGVYQLMVEVGGNEDRSAYARLSVTPDEAPDLRIVLPQDRVTSVGASQGHLDLTLEAEDDHGLDSVELVVTLAQGSGELVEFRQQRLPIRPDPTGTRATLQSRLNLSELGVEEGSELYFFVEARDNREPDANIGRSATHIVRFPGKRIVSADLGEGLPIVLPPEYFRSQRQIILDTEKLIAEQPDLSADEFQRRAEGLGFDQRALRMRYGTLLGEEFESGRPVGAGAVETAAGEEDHEHDEGGEAEQQGQLEGVPTDFVHLHDAAEIATFFTNEVRTRLKQVLAQMWGAEGQLRIHRPREALPFEYRALELLKDLQERSRIYVQKVGFETPPLEPERIRLTGDLEDIQTRIRSIQQAEVEPLVVAANELLASLQEEMGEPSRFSEEAGALVRLAIAEAATREPQALLALVALNRLVVGEIPNEVEHQSLEEMLWRLIPEPVERPRRGRGSTDPLAEMYRRELSEGVER